ncbi:hypothetical protein PQQ72_10540 [Paraburkholderia strydomiana]|uniref:hypothetical protein n=1 Tax=Paraburkholderia strydomiana TaxID=1245417 RepID=UPI0038B731E2
MLTVVLRAVDSSGKPFQHCTPAHLQHSCLPKRFKVYRGFESGEYGSSFKLMAIPVSAGWLRAVLYRS